MDAADEVSVRRMMGASGSAAHDKVEGRYLPKGTKQERSDLQMERKLKVCTRQSITRFQVKGNRVGEDGHSAFRKADSQFGTSF
jgi:hypothetical protein